MTKGYLCLVLHAHLPYVRHPEYPEFLEEDWLFEAITETYIPILSVFESLYQDGIDFRMTMSLTPPLCEMLVDDLLMYRYRRHLEKLIDLAEQEVYRTQNDAPEFHRAALMYEAKFKHARWLFLEKYQGNILNGFKKFQDMGKLEIITCCATHGLLPLMVSESAQRAQIRIAKKNYEKHFGRSPRGIWLAECAYQKGVDRILNEEGIMYFFVDSHGIMLSDPRPKHGVFAPVVSKGGAIAFGRDNETSKQVWSKDEGYPGDVNYREFYRDLGYDGHYDYILPYLKKDGVRRNIGIKYYKVTGRVNLGDKQPYDPDMAREKAAMHASNFIFNRQHQVRYLNNFLGQEPIVIAPYDAELFGHWWYEGPDFLNYVIRHAQCDQDEVKLTTPSEYISSNPKMQIVDVATSSWGDKGYFEYWLNTSNDWIYRHLHVAEYHMKELAQRFPNADGILQRALNQAARELLLAQSSDWAFIMTTNTMIEYAIKRTKDHVSRFHGLYLQICENRIEVQWVADLEWKDAIFQEIDYRAYL